MPVIIEYLDDCGKLNIHFMDHQLSFSTNKLSDESLSELVRAVLLTNPKKLNRVKSLILQRPTNEVD